MIDWHLSLCPTCSREAEGYFEVIRLARTLPPPAPSPELESRLRRFIAEKTRAVRETGSVSDDTKPETPLH